MSSKIKQISILGSTGSIGSQTIDILDFYKDKYKVGYLTVNNNIDLLEEQIKRCNPKGVAIRDEKAYLEFKSGTRFKGKILCGKEGIIEAAADSDNDLLLSALVGFSGVEPAYYAIKNGINIALANKETLVSAGSIITKSAKENNVEIFAVDSEHSAVLQCLVGENRESVDKIILTASGGPFFKTDFLDFHKITKQQALNHPNWDMGNKITIDSATMMNKGFEVIEAFWLFNFPMDKIDVVIHPQSIIHSMVQFVDGAIKAQLGLPDMKIPISYALDYPNRRELQLKRLDLTTIKELTFYKPDFNKFHCLKLAFEAINQGGNATAVLNAANEVAVAAFLNEKIRFTDIPICIANALENNILSTNPSLDEIIITDLETRKMTNSFIKTLKF